MVIGKLRYPETGFLTARNGTVSKDIPLWYFYLKKCKFSAVSECDEGSAIHRSHGFRIVFHLRERIHHRN